MSSNDDVRHQYDLLNIYRRNLKHLLRQKTTISQQNDILEARKNIERIKNILLGWHYEVDDQPNEFVPEETKIFTTKVSIAVDNDHTILVMPDTVYSFVKMAILRDYGVDISAFIITG